MREWHCFVKHFLLSQTVHCIGKPIETKNNGHIEWKQ